MALLSSYRRVLAVPGAWRFSLAGLVGRLPISMTGIGIVLLVQSRTGSYAVAGVVSAAFLVANAVASIGQGRLLDGLGQGRVLRVAAVGYGLSMSLLIWSVQVGLPRPCWWLLAALAGATMPQVGSSVRARWSHVLGSGPEVATAYALEAVVDESVYLVGPIVVTVLATTVDPVAGLATAAVAGVCGSLAFAAQHSTEPPAHRHRREDGRREPMPWPTVVPLAVVCLALGVLFGGAEVTTVAFATEHGHRAAAGPLLALWALGSMTSGLVTGALGWRSGPDVRVRWGTLAMACAVSPLALAGSIPALGLVLLVGGVTIAPTMVAALSLAEHRLPTSRLTEGMAVMHTGIVAGAAPGATLSGIVVDAHGASAAFLVSAAAGVLAALAAQFLPRRANLPEDSSRLGGQRVDVTRTETEGGPDGTPDPERAEPR